MSAVPISTAGVCFLVWIQVYPKEAHVGTQELPLGLWTQEACTLERHNCHVQRSAAKEEEVYSSCCGSRAPLEVEVLEFAGLQARHFDWSACRFMGNFQGQSGLWC